MRRQARRRRVGIHRSSGSRNGCRGALLRAALVRRAATIRCQQAVRQPVRTACTGDRRPCRPRTGLGTDAAYGLADRATAGGALFGRTR